MNGRQQPHFRLSQISGGYLNYSCTFCVTVRLRLIFPACSYFVFGVSLVHLYYPSGKGNLISCVLVVPCLRQKMVGCVNFFYFVAFSLAWFIAFLVRFCVSSLITGRLSDHSFYESLFVACVLICADVLTLSFFGG